MHSRIIMSRGFTLLFALAATSMHAQEPTIDPSQCRDLAEAGHFVGPDEILVNGKVCKILKKVPLQVPAVAEPAPAQGLAKLYFFRKTALLNSPESAYVDEFEVCRVSPEMFCVVLVQSGVHAIGQFSSSAMFASGQALYALTPEVEYYFFFAPNRWAELGCGLLGGQCVDPGWKLVAQEQGREEIKKLKQEEVSVPPGIPNSFPHRLLVSDVGYFETIRVRLGEQVEVSFLYTLVNDTDSEFRLPEESSALLVRETKASGWAKALGYQVQYPRSLLVPKGGKVHLVISRAYDRSGILKKGEEPTPVKIVAFLRQKTDSVDSFILYDTSKRFDILLPGDWRLKPSEVYGHPPQFFSDIKPELRACLEKIEAAGPAALLGHDGGKDEQWKTCFIR